MAKIKLKRFWTGLLLFVVSLLLTIPLTILAFIWNPVYFIVSIKWQSGFNALGDYFRKLVVSVDQFGNASTATILNFLLIKRNGIKFGDIDFTVSYILGRNYFHSTLSLFGRFIVWLLDLIDKEHVQNAVHEQIEKDQEALLRIQENEYFK
jgi:O-antigen/teichoic acid export membrane protein